ncbi:MAG: class I SAM-dependent methyltransferase [Desulfobacterales bacterium]|nr:class I SAM-dependent methyltransferase [Desulfobacterales bacterium]
MMKFDPVAAMNLDDLKRVNRLWSRIYPYIASQILDAFQKDSGQVLELGPFSGGISVEMARRCPGLHVTIADPSSQVLDYLDEEIKSAGLSEKINTRKSAFSPLVFTDLRFDLVISRGVYFFLDEEGNLFREILRVLKKGGMAFVGGGFGKDVPAALMDEISDESRVLNDRLGRKRVSVTALEQIFVRAGLSGNSRIVEEGGLWVTVKK